MEAACQVLLSPYQTWNRGRQSPGFFPHASASPGLLPEQHQTQAYHQIVKLQRFSQLTVCGNITSILMASYWQYLGSSLFARRHLLRSVEPLWHLCAVCKRKRVAKDLHWRLSLHFIRSYLKTAIWRVKLDLVRQFRRDQWSFISYNPHLRVRIPLPEIVFKLFLSEIHVGFMQLATILSP